MRPTVVFLHECLTLDTSTGLLTWKTRPVEHFQSRKVMAWWNGKYAGKRAGVTNSHGYIYLRFGKTNIPGHVICWAMTYGEYPETHLDHIDKNRQNNSILNLRRSEKFENSANRVKNSGTTSKYKGVAWGTRAKKWMVQITTRGKRTSLGYFDDEDEAGHAYNKAAIRLHGEFASLNPVGKGK